MPKFFRALAFGLILVAQTGRVMGQQPAVAAGGVAGLDLQTQLEKGLLARRPVEFDYIQQIVTLVEAGQLPREMVTTTFVWARKRPSRQLQYFQFALATRARKLPVVLPDLRQQAVGISSNGGQNGVTAP
jgi:hypothetical protein